MLDTILARLARVQEFDLSLGKWESHPREAKHIIHRQPYVSTIEALHPRLRLRRLSGQLVVHPEGKRASHPVPEGQNNSR